METITEQLLENIRNYEYTTGFSPSIILVDMSTFEILQTENRYNPEILHRNSDNMLVFNGVELRNDPLLQNTNTVRICYAKDYEMRFSQETEEKNEKNRADGSSDNN